MKSSNQIMQSARGVLDLLGRIRATSKTIEETQTLQKDVFTYRGDLIYRGHVQGNTEEQWSFRPA